MSDRGERSLRPVIGLTTYGEQAQWGANDFPVTLLHESYARMVAASGGVPVLLPSLYSVGAAAAVLLERLDGLLLSGGPDVDPARYGQPPGPRTTVTRPERDAAELALLSAALDLGLPVLAVCRGMQLLNVARGGTLVQHLPDIVGTDEHAPTPGVFGRHQVTVTDGTRLAGILGQTTVDVATMHHQALADVGAGLAVTAHADDGTIEAVEDDAHPFLVGVQWHPEAGNDLALTSALVEAAATYRSHS